MQNLEISIFLILIFASTAVQTTGKKEPPDLYDVRTSFRVAQGTKSFKLSCPIKPESAGGQEDNNVMVRWKKDGEEIIDESWGQGQYKLANRNRDLKFKSVNLSDQGTYTCMAINGWGHREKEFYLEVFDPSSDATSISLGESTSAPIWKDREAIDEIIKKGVRVNPGEKLELRCPAIGNPLPRIHWMKNGRVLTPNTNLELSNPRSAIFIHEKAQKTDSGLYACRLENNFGSLEAEFDVLVEREMPLFVFNSQEEHGGEVVESGVFHTIPGIQIPKPPTPIIDQPQNMSVRAGHIAQFVCKVEWPQEKLMIKWLKRIDDATAVKKTNPNATILHINKMHLLVLEQKNDQLKGSTEYGSDAKHINQLMINNVQKNDAGRYFCVVTNAAGQFVYKSAYLEVLEAPHFFSFGNMSSKDLVFSLVILFILGLATISIIWLSCCGRWNHRDAMVKTGVPVTIGTATNSLSTSTSPDSKTGCTAKGIKEIFLGNELFRSSVNTRTLQSDHHHHLPPLPPPRIPPRIPLPEAPINRGHLIQSIQQQPHTTGPQRKNFPMMEQQHHQNFMFPAEKSSTLGRSMGQSRSTFYPHQTMGRGSPPQLHRTTRADDELSRISSHIYASGSPTPHHHHLRNDLVPMQQQKASFQHSQPFLCNTQYVGCWGSNLEFPPPPPPMARPLTPEELKNEKKSWRNSSSRPQQQFTAVLARNPKYGRTDHEHRQLLIYNGEGYN